MEIERWILSFHVHNKHQASPQRWWLALSLRSCKGWNLWKKTEKMITQAGSTPTKRNYERIKESKMRAKINLEVSVTCFLHKPTRTVAWHSIIFLLKKCRIFYYKPTFLEKQLVSSPFCAPPTSGQSVSFWDTDRKLWALPAQVIALWEEHCFRGQQLIEEIACLVVRSIVCYYCPLTLIPTSFWPKF